jgi:hypothetical protein
MTRNSSVVTALNGVLETTTSAGVRVGQATKLAVVLTAGSISAGNGVFTFAVTADEPSIASPTWITYNRLVSNVTNTNAQTDTRVASVTLNSNTSSILFIPDADLFTAIRVTCTVTTDGAYTAKFILQTDG